MAQNLYYLGGYSGALMPASLATIVGLFLLGRPPAILWRVRAVVVDAVYRVLRRWAWTHIRNEGSVVVAPRIADSDAAPAIVLKDGIARVVAALFHSFPCSVLARLVGLPMSSVAAPLIRCGFAMEATATARIASLKPASSNYYGAAAVALTAPRVMFAHCVGVGSNHQPAVSVSDSVLQHESILAHG